MTRRHDCIYCQHCQDCGTDTGATGNQFMLRDELWRSVAREDELLCTDCAERRLGRKLRIGDFQPAPCNLESQRFLELLDGATR